MHSRLQLFTFLCIINNDCLSYRSICASIDVNKNIKELLLNFYLYDVKGNEFNVEILLITIRIKLYNIYQLRLLTKMYKHYNISSLLRLGHNLIELGFDNTNVYYSDITDISFNEIIVENRCDALTQIKGVFYSPNELKNPIYNKFYSKNIPYEGHFEIDIECEDNVFTIKDIYMQEKMCGLVDNEKRYFIVLLYNKMKNTKDVVIVRGIYPIFLRILNDRKHKLLFYKHENKPIEKYEYESLLKHIIIVIIFIVICVIININTKF